MSTLRILFGSSPRLFQALALYILLGAGLGIVQAAAIPQFDKPVLVQAREQPVADFLDELFGQIGVAVVLEGDIRGTVNGDFSKPAREVFEDIARSFQLTLYYDGAVAYVYPARDTARTIVPMSAATGQRVVASAESLGLVDSRNRLMTTDAGLVITGTRRFAQQVDELSDAIQHGEKPAPRVSSADTYRVFKLKYAWADDVTLAVGGQELIVPGVATLLRSLIEPGEVPAPGLSRRQNDRTLPGLRGEGLQSIGEVKVEDVEQRGRDSAKSPVRETRTANRSSRDTPGTRIVADSLHNSIVIRDRPERMADYEELIRSLDVEPSMIEIEATIIDMDTDRLRELGINWRLQNGDDEALLGSGNESDQLLRPNTDITPQGQGGIVSLVLGDSDNFIARIRALETQGAARIVSKPHVLTLSNVEALLDTTSTFFVRVEGQEEVDLFNVSVGTTLRVTPHVFDDSGRTQIKLLVTIEDGSTSDQSVDNIPVIESSTVNTQALIDVGQSLLIGGLVREFNGNAVTKVPVLGDIPGLGALFRSNRKSSSRVERMFLITPRLSLRPELASGKRLSVPYLAGTESEIIASSPTRLDETRQGLAARDNAHPVPESLPKAGGGNVTLSAADTSPAVKPYEPPAAPAGPRSLRDRLLRPPEPRPRRVAPTLDRVRQQERAPVIDTPDVNRAATEEDEWSPVPTEPLASPVSLPATTGAGVASGVSAGESSEPDAAEPDIPDGWQAVGE